MPPVWVCLLRSLEEPLGRLVHDGDLRQPDQESRLLPPTPASDRVNAHRKPWGWRWVISGSVLTRDDPAAAASATRQRGIVNKPLGLCGEHRFLLAEVLDPHGQDRSICRGHLAKTA